MKRIIIWLFIIPLFIASSQTNNDPKDESSVNLRQSYSGKFGFYQPGTGLNNGLLLGVDGITEFVQYNFFLSGAVDLYPKQTIDIFSNLRTLFLSGFQTEAIMNPSIQIGIIDFICHMLE